MNTERPLLLASFQTRPECASDVASQVAVGALDRTAMKKYLGHHRGRVLNAGDIPQASRASFWNRVGNFGGEGCWEYLGPKNRLGYGIVTIGRPGQKRYAHRIAWAISIGPIEADKVVCHKCDNASCVNPAHLFIGTVADNNRDMAHKGRARGPGLKGSKCPTSKLTEVEVAEIKQRLRTGRETHRQIAQSYGVVPQTISWIATGKRWTHVK